MLRRAPSTAAPSVHAVLNKWQGEQPCSSFTQVPHQACVNLIETWCFPDSSAAVRGAAWHPTQAAPPEAKARAPYDLGRSLNGAWVIAQPAAQHQG